MSYSGEVVVPGLGMVFLGAAAGLLVLGGAALVGTVKLTANAINAVNDAIKEKRFADAQAGLGEAVANISTIGTHLDEQMSIAEQRCREQFREAVERANRRVNEKPDISAYVASCEAALDKFDTEIERERKKIAENYIEKLDREIRKSRAEISEAKRQLDASIDRIKSEEDKRNAAKNAAESMRDELRTIIEDLERRSEGSKTAERIVTELKASFKTADEHIAQALYQSALAEVYSLRDTVFIRIEDMIKKDTLLKYSYAQAKGAAERCREQLKANTSVTYTRADNTTETANDFSRYFRGDYESMERKLTEIEALLAADYRDLSEEMLTDINRKLSAWSIRFMSASMTALERLDNYWQRRDTAMLIDARYVNNGYTRIRADVSQELDIIIFTYQNNDTGEQIEFRYKAVDDGAGHIQMVIETTDHTSYSGGLDEQEQCRNAMRNEIADNIRQRTGQKVKQRCTNYGVRDKKA